MNLDKKNILFSFFLTLSFTLVMPALFSWTRLIFFAPFLIILYYQKPFLTCLWASLACGLILDILSSYTRFGLIAVSYLMTSAVLYRQKRHFFADSLSTLPIMVFFFGMISSLSQFVLFNIFEKSFLISWKWVYSDLLIMPLCDAMYAFAVFIFPFVLVGKKPKRGKDFFLLQK